MRPAPDARTILSRAAADLGVECGRPRRPLARQTAAASIQNDLGLPQGQSRSPEHRQMPLNIAATWELLANDRIKTAEGLERIAKLEKIARKSRKPS